MLKPNTRRGSPVTFKQFVKGSASIEGLRMVVEVFIAIVLVIMVPVLIDTNSTVAAMEAREALGEKRLDEFMASTGEEDRVIYGILSKHGERLRFIEIRMGGKPDGRTE